eukprot:3018536-Rhodomonas_salina.1
MLALFRSRSLCPRPARQPARPPTTRLHQSAQRGAGKRNNQQPTTRRAHRAGGKNLGSAPAEVASEDSLEGACAVVCAVSQAHCFVDVGSERVLARPLAEHPAKAQRQAARHHLRREGECERGGEGLEGRGRSREDGACAACEYGTVQSVCRQYRAGAAKGAERVRAGGWVCNRSDEDEHVTRGQQAPSP